MTPTSDASTKQSRTFRKGGVGAMMDEYERAAAELIELVDGLSDFDFEAVRDRRTQDEDCRSIQTFMNHVVRAGYSYALLLRGALGGDTTRPEVLMGARREIRGQMTAMLAFTVATLEGHWEMPDAEIQATRMQSRWGTVYDVETMLEHAIVHILRHRRQAERFLTQPEFRPQEME